MRWSIDRWRTLGILAIPMAIVLAWAYRDTHRPVMVGRACPPPERRSMDEIDHSGWNRLLAEYVDDAGRVDYARWQRSSVDLQSLDDYLAELGRAEPSLPAAKAVRLAFWINAYNAVTVRGIVQVFPTPSIRRHTPIAFGFHIWHDLRLHVGDASYSLSQIEHEQLRPLGDCRIHFAIVCASMGCPQLRREAYVAPRIHAQLDEATRTFLADRCKCAPHPAAQRVAISQIFQWFQNDFGPTPQLALAALADYFPDEASRRAARDARWHVTYLDYDWRLNVQLPGASAASSRPRRIEEPLVVR